MSLASAWLGLFCVILSAAVPFVPGSSDPQAELTHLKPYSTADRLIVVAIYLSPASMCLGIIVLWQMASEARPLPQALINQRVQAWVGISPGLIGAAIIYIFVALRGPRGHL